MTAVSLRSRIACLAAGLALAPAGWSDSASRGFVPWRDSGFPRAEHRVLDDSEIYPQGPSRLPYRLDATVLFARETPWTPARAVRQIRLTARILEACEIRLGMIRLVRLSLAPDQRRVHTAESDLDTGVPPVVRQLSAMLPPSVTYPAAFLIGRVEGTKSLAISYRALDEGGPRAPYFDTAWISYPAHWLPRRDDRYSPLAHEFAHLLCRCGHAQSANRHLLHKSRNFLSANVLPEHCKQFQSSPLVIANN